MKPSIIALALWLIAGPCSSEALADAASVTLKGQVVCSDCWFEEKDRRANPYGTESDLKCAVRCSKAKIPQALAVLGESEATLYLLESGKFKKPGKDWLEYVGKQVEITGTVRDKGDKRYLKVDALRIISDESTGPQSRSEAGERKQIEREAPSLPVEAPEITLKDMSGREQKLSAFRGQKIVVLNFWATWCVPCREEMPVLVSLQERYGAQGVQVLGLSADEENTQKNIPAFVKKAKINFPTWVGATTREMRMMGLGEDLPATAIIDRDGRVVGRIIGMVEKRDLQDRIEWLLGNRSTPAPAVFVDNTKKHEGHEHGDDGDSRAEAGKAGTVPN